MVKYTGATCRLCRREDMKLLLKGDRRYTGKCVFIKRSYAPEQHGTSRKRSSNYGTRLREKQKTKRVHRTLESQFRNTYERAEKMRGIVGENLLKSLEVKLDNIAYRLGCGASGTEAKRLVNHDRFLVNGRKVGIMSFKVSANGVITVYEKSRGSERFKMSAKNLKTLPRWLKANVENFEGKVVAKSVREDIDVSVNETLIVELYSK